MSAAVLAAPPRLNVLDIQSILQLDGKKRRRSQGDNNTPVISLPEPTASYITAAIPRGLTFATIYNSPVGIERMKRQEWIMGKPWFTQPCPSGNWLFRLMQDSKGLNSSRQLTCCHEDEAFPHPAISTAILLALHAQHVDILAGYFLTLVTESTHVIQIGCPGKKLEFTSFIDTGDPHSIAAAAKKLQV